MEQNGDARNTIFHDQVQSSTVDKLPAVASLLDTREPRDAR